MVYIINDGPFPHQHMGNQQMGYGYGPHHNPCKCPSCKFLRRQEQEKKQKQKKAEEATKKGLRALERYLGFLLISPFVALITLGLYYGALVAALHIINQTAATLKGLPTP